MEHFDRLKLALADRYTVERKIGTGGMADVYLRHDVRHNRKVAIKVMHHDLAELVGVFEIGRSGGTRLTAEGGRDFGAEWTPDGKELIFSSERPFFDLYRRAADASQPEAALLTGSYDHYTGAVSRDGKLPTASDSY